MSAHSHVVRVTTVAAVALCALVFVLPSHAAAQRTRRIPTIPVNIESTPPGATVYLDSVADDTSLGTTPLRNVRVPRGTHTLIFRLAGHEEARTEISVRRRRETFRSTLRALGAIEVSSAGASALGAEVRVDGRVVATTLESSAVRVPDVTPGRHQVRATREGYRAFEQWVDVSGGEVVRLSVVLERLPPRVGSILVAADVQGAAVSIDGVRVGETTLVVDDIEPGTHSVVVDDGEHPAVTREVLVTMGHRATIQVTLIPAVTTPTTGALAVIVDAPGAIVRINGEALPAGTFTREGLAPGSYVVQVLAEGYVSYRSQASVEAGRTTTVDAQLQREERPPTRIEIRASVEGARISVDGTERSAPFVENTPEARTFAVTAHADGYEDWSGTCSTAPDAGEDGDCMMEVQLVAMSARLRVAVAGELPDEPAMLYIDDELVGPVPYQGRLPVGDHVIEVRAIGYETHREQMLIDASRVDQEIVVDAAMIDVTDAQARIAGTYSALPVPVGHPMFDASSGWPYLAELRLAIGVHELFDAGFAIRTFGRLTEFEGRTRFGARVLRPLALGVEVRAGGGIGPQHGLSTPVYASAISPELEQNEVPIGATGRAFDIPTNTLFLTVQGNASLLLEPWVIVTVWAGADFLSDEYGGHPRREGVYLEHGPGGMQDVICNLVDGPDPDTDVGDDLACRRQDMARLRIGGALEVTLDRYLNLFLVLEGIVAQPSDTRRVLGGFLFDSPDIRFYPRLGATFKF